MPKFRVPCWRMATRYGFMVVEADNPDAALHKLRQGGAWEGEIDWDSDIDWDDEIGIPEAGDIEDITLIEPEAK